MATTSNSFAAGHQIAKHQPADAAEPIDGNANCHGNLLCKKTTPLTGERQGCRRMPDVRNSEGRGLSRPLNADHSTTARRGASMNRACQIFEPDYAPCLANGQRALERFGYDELARRQR